MHMSLQIDPVTRTLSLSVKDVCTEIVGGGSLNLLPLAEARRDLGREIHQEHQSQARRQNPAYRQEQAIRFQIRVRAYEVTIQGRMDGVYFENDTWILEEIKSIPNLRQEISMETVPSSPVVQLRVYLYLWGQVQGTDRVTGRLTVIGLDRSNRATLEIPAEKEETELLIMSALERLIDRFEARLAEQHRKQCESVQLPFPFPSLRKHQDSMVSAIESALAGQRQLLVSAPSGVGKTVAALYATLKFALQNGLCVFFVTSKNTQQRIVADTLRLWVGQADVDQAGVPTARPFTCLFLQSKEKSCANDIVFCHEARCRYARDFYGKLEDSHLVHRLGQLPILQPGLLYQQAIDHDLCPYELSLELIPQADLVVCDYNYVYDPQTNLRGIFDCDYSRVILVVDEAHNLYSRAREYYSSSLERNCVKNLLYRLSSSGWNPSEFQEPQGAPPGVPTATCPEWLPESFRDTLLAFLTWLDGHFAQVGESFPECHETGQGVVLLDRPFFAEVHEELQELMRNYLALQRGSSLPLDDETGLLDFFYQVSNFCRALLQEGEEFIHLLELNPKRDRIQVLCLDASNQLRERNAGFYAVIGMSATLSPLMFYRDVLGFDRDTRLLSLPSPFPTENRKILIIPQVTTAFRERSQNSPRIARIIQDVIDLRPGNYFAFFPSFEYLEEVAAHLSVPGWQVLMQSRWMADHARQGLLEKLSVPGGQNLVLAVQGGIFAEGVDYPGEMAVGALIVGPGLPKVSFEQELIRDYFERQFSQGFEYAYLYPGMNRVVQSAGRIIRSETDRGVILLLDKRFAYEHYARHLPEHWYDSSPAELVCRDYQRELGKFWKSLASGAS